MQSVTKHCYRQTRSGGWRLPILTSSLVPFEDRLGDPRSRDRPEVTFLKDWSEVSAPVQELAALAQVPQVPVLPAARPLAPVLAARLLALVPGPEQAQALAPEEASELA